jgi:hypothetical protein
MRQLSEGPDVVLTLRRPGKVQAISWTASQAATMAQVIPVIAIALGLELREVRKRFDDLAPETSSGKHGAKQGDEHRKAEAKESVEEKAAKEFLLRRTSRYVMVGFWGCLAMIALMVGEQSSIAIVLGRSSYNNLNIESLAMRAAVTIVFLSPVVQLILSFMEAGFRRKKMPFDRRYRLLSGAIVVMTAVGVVFTYRGY